MENGLTPIAVKEIVYQATDYLGYGRILPFLRVTNETFAERGIELPLDGQATTTLENRLEKGVEAQTKIFGAHMQGGLENRSYQPLAGGELLLAITIPEAV